MTVLSGGEEFPCTIVKNDRKTEVRGNSLASAPWPKASHLKHFWQTSVPDLELFGSILHFVLCVNLERDPCYLHD